MKELGRLAGLEGVTVGIRRALLLGGLVLFLGGCQSFDKTGLLSFGSAPALKAEATFDNVGFMDLWTTYSSCQSGVDLISMKKAVIRLTTAVDRQVAAQQAVPPLLAPIQQFVSPQPTRLAVDPQAMAAACTLYTGQTAMTMGQPEVAAEMFYSVLLKHSHDDYRYYTKQAQIGLSQLGVVDLVAGPDSDPSFTFLAVSGNPNNSAQPHLLGFPNSH
jgi:hypothetical protein